MRLGLAAVQHRVAESAVGVLRVHFGAQADLGALLAAVHHLRPHGLVLRHAAWQLTDDCRGSDGCACCCGLASPGAPIAAPAGRRRSCRRRTPCPPRACARRTSAVQASQNRGFGTGRPNQRLKVVRSAAENVVLDFQQLEVLQNHLACGSLGQHSLPAQPTCSNSCDSLAGLVSSKRMMSLPPYFRAKYWRR